MLDEAGLAVCKVSKYVHQKAHVRPGKLIDRPVRPLRPLPPKLPELFLEAYLEHSKAAYHEKALEGCEGQFGKRQEGVYDPDMVALLNASKANSSGGVYLVPLSSPDSLWGVTDFNPMLQSILRPILMSTKRVNSIVLVVKKEDEHPFPLEPDAELLSNVNGLTRSGLEAGLPCPNGMTLIGKVTVEDELGVSHAFCNYNGAQFYLLTLSPDMTGEAGIKRESELSSTPDPKRLNNGAGGVEGSTPSAADGGMVNTLSPGTAGGAGIKRESELFSAPDPKRPNNGAGGSGLPPPRG